MRTLLDKWRHGYVSCSATCQSASTRGRPSQLRSMETRTNTAMPFAACPLRNENNVEGTQPPHCRMNRNSASYVSVRRLKNGPRSIQWYRDGRVNKSCPRCQKDAWLVVSCLQSILPKLIKARVRSTNFASNVSVPIRCVIYSMQKTCSRGPLSPEPTRDEGVAGQSCTHRLISLQVPSCDCEGRTTEARVQSIQACPTRLSTPRSAGAHVPAVPVYMVSIRRKLQSYRVIG
ncbi:hypothetical protein CH063_11357 [Colletotrichum higginsianum]|uniref:Uncharacterized protein n=1 Tax=Colletotrichum higginsianum (strain IMI 349063) TaxID=759273 RepID=H1VL16_COLHI|nr:hypothetical protein CH063_11357 [Colletotrichum higginsianum]